MEKYKEVLYIGDKKTAPITFEPYDKISKSANAITLCVPGAGINNLCANKVIKRNKSV